MHKLHPGLTIRLFTEEKCFGPGVARLLRQVEQTHSLRAAAMSMQMAYSNAWTIVKKAERELGFPLLHSTTGGRSGGGATLTAEAVRLLESYEAFCQDVNEHARQAFQTRFSWLEQE